MSAATLTSKGQITVPKPVRDALRLRPGDRLSFRLCGDGTVVVEPERTDLRSLFGVLTTKTTPRGITVEDMKEAVRRTGSRR